MSNSRVTHEAFVNHSQIQMGSERSFGFVFALMSLLYTYLPLLSGEPARLWGWVPAIVFFILALAFPKVLQPFNILWFRFGMMLSKITTPLVMGLLFYGVITPFGIVMRATGRDPLLLTWNKSAGSYWIPRTPPGPLPEKMAKPF